MNSLNNSNPPSSTATGTQKWMSVNTLAKRRRVASLRVMDGIWLAQHYTHGGKSETAKVFAPPRKNGGCEQWGSMLP